MYKNVFFLSVIFLFLSGINCLFAQTASNQSGRMCNAEVWKSINVASLHDGINEVCRSGKGLVYSVTVVNGEITERTITDPYNENKYSGNTASRANKSSGNPLGCACGATNTVDSNGNIISSVCIPCKKVVKKAS